MKRVLLAVVTVLATIILISAPQAAHADIAMPNTIAYWNMNGVSGQPVSAPGPVLRHFGV